MLRAVPTSDEGVHTESERRKLPRHSMMPLRRCSDEITVKSRSLLYGGCTGLGCSRPPPAKSHLQLPDSALQSSPSEERGSDCSAAHTRLLAVHPPAHA